jgi:hypothetical protein
VPGGLVAYDGEMLVCNWVGITRGMPGNAPTIGEHPLVTLLFYEYEVTFLRTVKGLTGSGPGGGIPTSPILQADYDKLANDAENLIGAVIQCQVDQQVVPIGIPFAYGPMSSIGPEGGLGGSRIAVSFQCGMSSNQEY